MELTGEAYFEVMAPGSLYRTYARYADRGLGNCFQYFGLSGRGISDYTCKRLLYVDAGEGRSLILETFAAGFAHARQGRHAGADGGRCILYFMGERKINFRDRRLEDIMKILSRWYNIEVDYADERLKNKRFGCYVNRYEEIAPFLDLLEATENIYVRINGNTIKHSITNL